MRTIKDKIAVVTGGAGGLGRAIALRLAREGAHLHLIDIDRAALDRTAAEVSALGVKCDTSVCDLADEDAIDRLADSLIARHGSLDILVNNAGVAWYGPTTKMPPAQWDRLLAINLHAPIRLTTKLLPTLLAQPEAHVVNIASIAGWVCGGRYAAYHVSKFGLVGFSEALRAEFSRQGLGVTAVCPGPVLTSLYKNAPCGNTGRETPSPPAWLCTTPQRVADATIRAIYRNRAVTFVGIAAHLLRYAKRLAPWIFYALHDIGRSKSIRRKQAAAAKVSPAQQRRAA
jgi:short-subunit dehydrogenase